MPGFLKHILWATDYSEESDHALLYADLFSKTFGAKLSALHVVPDFSPVLYEAHPALEAELTGRVETAVAASEARIREISKSRGIAFGDVLVRKGSPAAAICRAITKEHADLVVLGLTGADKGEGAMGTVAREVLRNSSVPVLVTKKKKGRVCVEKILVPTDFTEGEERERDFAWNLAKGFKATLGFLYVMELFGHDFRLPDHLFDTLLRKLQERERREHEDIKIVEEVTSARRAYEGIANYGEKHAYDLIVMSTHVGRLARYFLGSTTEKVIARAGIPVFAIPSSPR